LFKMDVNRQSLQLRMRDLARNVYYRQNLDHSH